MPLSIITLAVDREHDLPVPPEVIGASVFVFMCILMTALLVFGKGRPHG
jgi:hypothetical protein